MSARIKRVEDMGKWLILKAALIEHGYKAWQSQYGVNSPEGYHVTFSADGKEVEVVTHNSDIAADISKSNLWVSL